MPHAYTIKSSDQEYIILATPRREDCSCSLEPSVGSPGRRPEGQPSSIATEIIVAGEMQYREHREWTHKEKIRRREEMRQAEIRRKLEAERAEREQLIKLEADRLKHLTDSAESYHRAQKIRAFVSTVVDLPAEGVDRARIARWQQWALIQADKLDPI